MEKPHPWMKVPSLDVIHGWRNDIHGCYPWMEKCHPLMKVSRMTLPSMDVIHGWHSQMELILYFSNHELWVSFARIVSQFGVWLHYGSKGYHADATELYCFFGAFTFRTLSRCFAAICLCHKDTEKNLFCIRCSQLSAALAFPAVCPIFSFVNLRYHTC